MLSDMLRSVAVIGVIMLGAVFIGSTLLTTPDQQVPTVDYKATVADVREVAPYEVVAPQSLPDGWRATSAEYEHGSEGRWHLGVLTADDEYVGLEQTPRRQAEAVEEFSPDTEPRGKTAIGGDTWRVRANEQGETTLVRRSGGVTTLVTGTASRNQLESYVASLSAGPG